MLLESLFRVPVNVVRQFSPRSHSSTRTSELLGRARHPSLRVSLSIACTKNSRWSRKVHFQGNHNQSQRFVVVVERNECQVPTAVADFRRDAGKRVTTSHVTAFQIYLPGKSSAYAYNWCPAAHAQRYAAYNVTSLWLSIYVICKGVT